MRNPLLEVGLEYAYAPLTRAQAARILSLAELDDVDRRDGSSTRGSEGGQSEAGGSQSDQNRKRDGARLASAPGIFLQPSRDWSSGCAVGGAFGEAEEAGAEEFLLAGTPARPLLVAGDFVGDVALAPGGWRAALRIDLGELPGWLGSPVASLDSFKGLWARRHEVSEFVV
eukprot:1352410-Pyramimonas_sp.AAC.1